MPRDYITGNKAWKRATFVFFFNAPNAREVVRIQAETEFSVLSSLAFKC